MFSIKAIHQPKEEPPKQDNVIIRVDPSSGLCEFPVPGDAKKHLLPTLVDPEEDIVGAPERHTEELRGEREFDSQFKDFWMPDRLCKVCYGCEDAFTMYRRKHHCRMCGQIFCNQCSSHYIDGVRACRLCHDQISERSMYERHALTLGDNNKLLRRRAAPTNGSHLGPAQDLSPTVSSGLSNDRHPHRDGRSGDRSSNSHSGRGSGQGRSSGLSESGGTFHSQVSSVDNNNNNITNSTLQQEKDEEDREKKAHVTNLQNRASAHLEAIVGQLVNNSPCLGMKINVTTTSEKHTSSSPGTHTKTTLSLAEKWKSTIVGLVREVVSSVDPNVRKGDSLDIRPYVKLKIIPGGSMDECVFVDGVVRLPPSPPSPPLHTHPSLPHPVCLP